MNVSEYYAKIGLTAMRRAAKQARLTAALHGLKIPVWKNGRIVYEEPMKGRFVVSSKKQLSHIFKHRLGAYG